MVEAFAASEDVRVQAAWGRVWLQVFCRHCKWQHHLYQWSLSQPEPDQAQLAPAWASLGAAIHQHPRGAYTGGDGPNSARGKAIFADPCWKDGSVIIFGLLLDGLEVSVHSDAPLATLLKCVERCFHLVVSLASAERIGLLIDQLHDLEGRKVLLAAWLRAPFSPSERLMAALRWRSRFPFYRPLNAIIAAQADQETIQEIIDSAGPSEQWYWFSALSIRGEPWARRLAAEQAVQHAGSIRWYVLQGLRSSLGSPARYPDSSTDIDGAWQVLAEHWDQLQYDDSGCWPEEDASDMEHHNDRYHAVAAADALFCLLGGAWVSRVKTLPGLSQRFAALPATSTRFRVATQEACVAVLEDVDWRMGTAAAAWARDLLGLASTDG